MADMLLVICVVTSAYFIRGITGFGSGLISVPLLALSFPLTFAIPLILALDFTASIALGGINQPPETATHLGQLLRAEQQQSKNTEQDDLGHTDETGHGVPFVGGVRGGPSWGRPEVERD